MKTIHWEELCGHVLLSWLYEISPLDGGMTWHLHSLEGAFVSHAGVMNRWNLSPQSIPSGHSFALSTLTMDRQINWDSVPLIEINSLFTALPGFPLTPHSFKSMIDLKNLHLDLLLIYQTCSCSGSRKSTSVFIAFFNKNCPTKLNIRCL